MVGLERILKINTFGALDLSSSKSSKSDYTAGGVIGIDTYGRIFVLDSFMERSVDPLDAFERMISFIIKYKCLDYVMEKNRFEYLMDTVSRLMDSGYFSERYDMIEFRRAYSKISTIFRNERDESKVERIESVLQPLIKSHSIFLASWMRDERKQFKNYMIHDDFLDWLSQAVRISYSPSSKFMDQNSRPSVIAFDRSSSKSVNEQLAEDTSWNPWTGLYHSN